jgi:hypothetical protein
MAAGVASTVWTMKTQRKARDRTFVMWRTHLDPPKPDLVLNNSVWQLM